MVNLIGPLKTTKPTVPISTAEFFLRFGTELVRRLKGLVIILVITSVANDSDQTLLNLAKYFGIASIFYFILALSMRQSFAKRREAHWLNKYYEIKSTIYIVIFFLILCAILFNGDPVSSILIFSLFVYIRFFNSWFFQKGWRSLIIELSVLLICVLNIFLFNVEMIYYLLLVILIRIAVVEIFKKS